MIDQGIIQRIKILIIEDDPGHSLLIQKNLRRVGIFQETVVLNDGEAARSYLFDQNGMRSQDPLLLLLDLNLPVYSGLEILKMIKGNPDTNHIPVIILTTSDSQEEVETCYELGCNFFITKPVGYQEFSKAIQEIGLFVSLIALPGGTL